LTPRGESLKINASLDSSHERIPDMPSRTPSLPAKGTDLVPFALTGLALLADQEPTVTPNYAITSWTVRVGPLDVNVRYDYERRSSLVYVDTDVAIHVDAELGALDSEEESLGDDRWLERGVDPKIDGLYDRLNDRMGFVKTAIAAAVLPRLVPTIDDSPRLTEGLAFPEWESECHCNGCVPGVKAPDVRKDGCYVQATISWAPGYPS
jgi:hypothetical protein